MNAHPAIESLEARIVSDVSHTIVFNINHRRFHKVASSSFSLAGFGVSPEIACRDFLLRNKLEA